MDDGIFDRFFLSSTDVAPQLKRLNTKVLKPSLLKKNEKIKPKIYAPRKVIEKKENQKEKRKKPYYAGDPKKYQVILADPPWHYRNDSSEGTCHRHYSTMKDDELYKFPIDDIADKKQCALLLWCTAPKLDVAFELIKRWRFTYKTIFFTWCKINKKGTVIPGIGNYTRSSTELCLVAVRGNIMPWKASNKTPQVIMARRQQHSQKPDEAIERINEFFIKDIRKIELFSRQPRIGWDAWGNETDKFTS